VVIMPEVKPSHIHDYSHGSVAQTFLILAHSSNIAFWPTLSVSYTTAWQKTSFLIR
jgi:hypothetical protein